MNRSKDTVSGDVIQLLSDVCRQAGLKLTRQQVQALRESADYEDAATADQMKSQLQVRLPALSRETLRETLGELQRAGIVREVENPDEIARSNEKESSGPASPASKGARASGFPAGGDDRNKQVQISGKAGEYRC
jgi:hypothetical protein